MRIPSTLTPLKNSRPMRAAFTLIEVLVVILIIVLLVSAVISIAQLAQNRAAQAQCITDINAWKDALETYKERTGTYPADTNVDNSDGLQDAITALYPTANDKHNLNLRDPWGMEFRYRSISKTRYTLGSLGMDRLYGDGQPTGNAASYPFLGDGDDITIDNGRM